MVLPPGAGGGEKDGAAFWFLLRDSSFDYPRPYSATDEAEHQRVLALYGGDVMMANMYSWEWKKVY